MIEKLFPVQEQLIPIILNKDNSQSIYPNDLAITAPTGSGKTLTYVLPLIDLLKNRIKPCLTALVIVPVSDLAEQVYNVFRDNLKETDLKIALLSTKHSFSKEQETLIDKKYSKICIDIIVTTPGRLVDHLQKTNGFEVDNLKYLIIDECDRIMDQIKQNWLSCLFNALSSSKRSILQNENLNVNNLIFDKARIVPMQKILLSATLTRNPEMLDQIKLFQTRFFNIRSSTTSSSSTATIKTQEKSSIIDTKSEIKEILPKDENLSVPNELSQLFIQCSSIDKPLMAIYLIKELKYNNMLLFVKSIDTAKRLSKLFELNGVNSMEYSSSLHVSRRKRILNKFEQNKVDVLVCSDLIARGMDLLNVNYVLLYDAPTHLNSYIHRIGRKLTLK
jgi:ATP-dependent RNA helicase DDX51/DBP6